MKINNLTLMLPLSALIMIGTNSCMSGRNENNDRKIYEAAIIFDTQSQEIAFQQYQKLVKNGDRRALPLLASCYMYGAGVEKNEDEARVLYRNFSGGDLLVPSKTIPIDIRIEITGDDIVKVDGLLFRKEDECLDGLVKQIHSFQLMARELSCPVTLDIIPHRDTSHLRILNVIDACFRAGVEFPYFYSEGLPERPKMRV